jgi:hypothetical protein
MGIELVVNKGQDAALSGAGAENSGLIALL